MAELVQDKTTGLKFAEEQLLRHGWEKGKGLGRSENGISEAIKVKVKCDKGGVGHKEGEQFTFHWWDHVFNKASSSLVVEAGQNGVMVKKSDDSSDGQISNKKPRKAQQAKSMLYGCFVKSATLLSGEEQPEKTCDSDDDSSSSEDEDQKLDLSSTTKLSDADLLKACGGRTAHKGARHGLTMSAKLARLEQQEQDFMNKYGKKKNTAETPTNSERHPDIKEKTKPKKSKKQEETSENSIPDTSKDNEKEKNKTRKDSNDDMTEPKKKKNRKDKEAPEDGLNGDTSVYGNGAITQTSEDGETLMKKKKKKKKTKQSEVISDTNEISEDHTNTHEKQPQEGSIEQQQTSDSVSKRKKKKKKSEYQETSAGVENATSEMMVTEDTSSQSQTIDTQPEGQENSRKKSKKKKRSKEQEQENVENEESRPKKKKNKSKE